MAKLKQITVREFSQPMGNLQKALTGGAYDPYHSELGDGKMAMLAAEELRTGKEVQISQETPPTAAERAFALMKELFLLLRPSDEMRDQRDQPDWKFDKRKNRWVQVVPKIKPVKKKKAAKTKRKKRR